MQCAPHTPFPHCTEPHCVPPCTPHPASKRQITTTTEGGEKMNEDEWMCPPSIPPFARTPPPPPLLPSTLPSIPDRLPSCMPFCVPPSAYPWFCGPVLWLWPVCITHVSVSAAPPSGRPYKGLSFPKVRSEPCTQVLSRHLVWKNKNGLLAPSVSCVCLSRVGMTSMASVSDVLSLFSSSSRLSFARSTVVGELGHTACVNWQPRRKSYLPFGVPCYWKCREGKCDTTDFNRHD